MKNAVETAHDDVGVAGDAASLGADGGPLTVEENLEDIEVHDDLDEIEDFEDESWLDEELSEEELAALGEEDFGEEDQIDFDGDELAALDEEETDEAIYENTEELAERSLSQELRDLGAHVGEENLDDEPNWDEISNEVTNFVEEPVETGTVIVETDGDTSELTDSVSYGAALGSLAPAESDCRPVPRISIHAFCESPAMTELLEQAASDRRLSKTHLTIHMGGVVKATDHFRSAATPNLVILETLATGEELFAQLGELAEYCDPSTKVIVIGQLNDIALYRELVRQGISEYLVRPNSPLQIISSIAGLYIDPSAPPIGKTIAFVGARGGVGSSTIAHNVGWCVAEEFESDTIIMDLDLPFGTASLDFEQDPTSGLVEALGSPERLDDVLLDRLLQKHTEHLSLFTAPNLLDRDYDLDDQAFETVIDVVRASAPTIIIDVPHMWTSWSRRLLQSSDEIVITATPDLASFRNTKNLVDVISGSRPNDGAPTLVLNQFDSKFSAVQAEQFIEHVGIDPALILGWEPQLFNTAMTNASPIVEVGPKTKTAQGLRDLAARLIGRDDALLAKSRFSLSNLFKKR